MKTKFRSATLLLIFFISISPISLPVKQSQAITTENINFDQEWTTDQTIDKNITISAGVTLVVRNGVTLTFKNGNINVLGNLVISGTAKSPVLIKKDDNSQYFSISVPVGGNLTMRNTDISGGGAGIFLMQNKSLLNTANAYYQGGIHAKGGTLDIQGSNFHDNDVAIYIDRASSGKVIVNRSKFFNNSSIDVGFADYYATDTVNFKYNWWGTAGGPVETCEIYGTEKYCYYEKVQGNIDFSDWLKSENFHDPVVIIPGVFGSQKEDGIWKIDPIFHVYDNLFDEFVKNGYTSGKDLFIFPYEWRDSNVENAIKLRYKIAEIKTIANWPKVDIVAHSMGGLMAREYIESNAYQNNVDQLITLGTPNNGSPEIYPLWEAGKAIGAVQTGMKKFMDQEREEAGFANMFEYIRNRPVSSAQELLPNHEYLLNVDGSQPLIYPNDYPVNAFLDNLNSATKIKKLANVEYTKIAGKVDSDISTISGFNVVKVDMGEIWKHGYPLGFEIPMLGDRGAIDGFGDGTVPIASAKSSGIPSDNYLELDSAHTDLPTKAQKDVLETLTGVRPSSEVTDGLIKNMLQIFAHSPIDIQIISPSQKKYGKDFATGKNFESIDGSFYSGFDNIENEFITIPNPEDGEYKIVTEGTEDGGEYRVEAVKISENPDGTDNAIESSVEIRGTAIPDKIEELKIEVAGDQVTSKNSDVTAPETKIELSGTQGSGNWFTSDVIANLSATDDEGGSGIDVISFSLDSGATWQNYSQPLNIFSGGISTIQYYSIDKAGNKEEIKTATIKIDKTAPDARIVFNSSMQKLDIIGIDNLSENVSVETKEQMVAVDGNKKDDEKNRSRFSSWFHRDKEKEKKIVVTATLTDEAGHKTEIVWEKRSSKDRRIDLTVSSIAYDGNSVAISGSALQYKWMQDWRRKRYLLFATHLSTNSMSLESHYFPSKNQTWLMEKPTELGDDDSDDNAQVRPVWKKISGMVIPNMTTEKGMVKINY